MTQDTIMHRLHTLGIKELQSVDALNELPGDSINLDCNPRVPSSAPTR